MAEETHLQRIKGSDPEQFIFIAFDRSEAKMKHMSDAMSEAAVRAYLGGNGMSEHELNTTINTARKHEG
jgi:hypothetical protein